MRQLSIWTVLLMVCLLATSCNRSATTSTTAPTPIQPSIGSGSLQGRWEGSYLYERTEPAGCPVIGLSGPTCPTTAVPMTLRLTQVGNVVTGDLTSTIFGDAGTAGQPVPLTGQVASLSSLELTGEQLGGDSSCAHTTLRRMVSFTLRRPSTDSLEGEFHFDGDRRSSSCFFFDVQVFAQSVRLLRVSP